CGSAGCRSPTPSTDPRRDGAHRAGVYRSLRSHCKKARRARLRGPRRDGVDWGGQKGGNMRFRTILVASMVFTVLAVTVAPAAAPRLETPRATVREGVYRTARPGGTLAPLGIGNPNSFAM